MSNSGQEIWPITCPCDFLKRALGNNRSLFDPKDGHPSVPGGHGCLPFFVYVLMLHAQCCIRLALRSCWVWKEMTFDTFLDFSSLQYTIHTDVSASYPVFWQLLSRAVVVLWVHVYYFHMLIDGEEGGEGRGERDVPAAIFMSSAVRGCNYRHVGLWTT